MTQQNMRSGGKLLVDQLVVHGATHVFCVPGESYLAALDAFADVEDKITLITGRHEASADARDPRNWVYRDGPHRPQVDQLLARQETQPHEEGDTRVFRVLPQASGCIVRTTRLVPERWIPRTANGLLCRPLASASS